MISDSKGPRTLNEWFVQNTNHLQVKTPILAIHTTWGTICVGILIDDDKEERKLVVYNHSQKRAGFFEYDKIAGMGIVTDALLASLGIRGKNLRTKDIVSKLDKAVIKGSLSKRNLDQFL